MTRPMTIAEKILAAHAGLDEVKPGQLITAKLDITLANDITGPVAIKEFKKIGIDKVFDQKRVVFVPDHFVPNKDIKSAQQAKMVREFSKEQNLKNYFEVGRMGIEHALLPEKGIVTASFFALQPFLIIVKASAIGSCTLIHILLKLPTRLSYARYQTFIC